MEPSRLPFFKYQGLGNDFVLFDGIGSPLPVERLTDAAVARGLCDRHLGIGADGILLLLPPVSEGAQARMRVLNADGSEPEMCGNGIRCAAKALHDHLLPSPSGATQMAIDTGAGRLCCQLTLGTEGLVHSVRVDMGKPSLDRETLPMLGQGPFIEAPIRVGGMELQSTAIRMGNPHLVTFVGPEESPRALAERLGEPLENHPVFPKRANVEFARPRADGIELWVWERGCGITQACGTGACATAVAAVVTKRRAADEPIPIHLPGGTLTVTVENGLSRVWMDGPAVEVYRGQIAI